MNFIDSIKQRARQNIKTIVLPEASDLRIIKAAATAIQEKYANIEEGHINLNKISIDIDYTSVSNKGVTIIVTDNNDENLPWTEGFRIQKKENEAWIDLEPINDLITPAISHWKDENNQYKQSIDWSYCYGELNVGEYRIVKPIFNPQNNSYIDFYSDAFKINK